MLGGAGNVAANVTSLGARVVLIGLVGEDEAGGIVRQLVTELPDAKATLVPRRNYPTVVETRVVARNQQVIRLDNELIKARPLWRRPGPFSQLLKMRSTRRMSFCSPITAKA